MAMDQQAAMERLRELYQEKNEHLAKFLEPVTPFEFYREIFPVGSFERKGHYEDEKGNGIAVTVPKAAGIALEIEGDGKAKRYTITDELSELAEVFDTDFTIMSPLSYFGRRRCGKNARYLYALVHKSAPHLLDHCSYSTVGTVLTTYLSHYLFVLPDQKNLLMPV